MNSPEFLKHLDEQERISCRKDMDAVTEGRMTADAFLAKWGRALSDSLLRGSF